MPLLYYWRADNYARDLDYGAGYHLNQSSKRLHEVEKGDSLWAFTRAPNGRYVLAAELIVQAKTSNSPNYRYGEYRLWGDLERSRYFKVNDEQPSVEHVVRQLSLKTAAQYLGRSFQGKAAVRHITEQDHQMLATFAQDLPLEPRARILPEERLEAALLTEQSREVVYDLIEEEEPGVAEERRKYLYQTAPARNQRLAKDLQELYDGRCQVCTWNPRSEYGKNLCHAHHIHWLSRGGEDALDNLMLVCPNHHGAIHKCDAPFDFRSRTYDFGLHTERIALNKHLPLWK